MLAGTIVAVVGVEFTKVVVKAVPLQIVAVCAGITGFGFTVAVTVKVAPVQLPEVGVTVYVAVCDTLVGLVSVPKIVVCAVPNNPPVREPVTVGAAHV